MASDSTVSRAFHEITPSVRAGLCEAVAEVRSQVWARSATNEANPVYLVRSSSVTEGFGIIRTL